MTKLSGFVETTISDEEKEKISSFITSALELAKVVRKEIDNEEHINLVKGWFFTKKHFSEKSVKNKYPKMFNRWLWLHIWTDVTVLTDGTLRTLTDIHYKLTIENTVLLSTDEAYALELARKQEYKLGETE